MQPETPNIDQNRRSPRREPDVHFHDTVETGPDGTLYADLDQGSIRVEVHDQKSVVVDARVEGPAADLVSFALERDGDDVYFDCELAESRVRWLHQARVRVRIAVPTPFSVDLRTGAGHLRARGVGAALAAETSAGSVRVSDVRGPVLLRSAGGPIRAEDVAGDLRAYTMAGPIQIRRIAGSAELRTSAGHIRATEVRACLDARTNAGPIFVSFDTDPAGALRSVAGPVEVRLQPGAGAELDARAVAGRVRIDPALSSTARRSPSRVVGRLGRGGAALLLRSAVGGIHVGETTD